MNKCILVGLCMILFNNCSYKKLEYKNASDREMMQFEMNILNNNLNAIDDYLKKGYDPNKCIGPVGWMNDNPLWVAMYCMDDNTEVIKTLINYGANVNLRPYIWAIVNQHILTPVQIQWMNEAKDGEERIVSGTTEELMYKKIIILIDAGADVDMKGAQNKILLPNMDITYKIYFATNGSRPINYAIEKNITSIVDLLLKYTKLDEASLKAAQESNDPTMIENVNKLWKMQQLEERKT